jgi:hypothetical protein
MANRQLGEDRDWSVPPYYSESHGSQAHPHPRHMNGMAIMALVSVFVFGPLAVIFGHIARHQIRRSGDYGAGIALGSLITGYVETAFIFIMIAVGIASSSPS